MTIYKKGIIISSILSVVSFLSALMLNYKCLNQFWYNVMLGIFTGAMLNEYSCAMKSHFRKSGNQMSGKWKSSYASLLA